MEEEGGAKAGGEKEIGRGVFNRMRTNIECMRLFCVCMCVAFYFFFVSYINRGYYPLRKIK